MVPGDGEGAVGLGPRGENERPFLFSKRTGSPAGPWGLALRPEVSTICPGFSPSTEVAWGAEQDPTSLSRASAEQAFCIGRVLGQQLSEPVDKQGESPPCLGSHLAPWVPSLAELDLLLPLQLAWGPLGSGGQRGWDRGTEVLEVSMAATR